MLDDQPDNPAFLSAAVYSSPAFVTYRRLHFLGVNFYVLRRNYLELKNVLVAGQSPEAFRELWTVGKEENLQQYMAEITRLLHNFTASAKSYIDHTRAVINDWYTGKQFLDEYNEEVRRRFLRNPLTGFIEELRNFALHFSLPITIASITFETDPQTKEQRIVQAFKLDKSDLLRWDRWTNNKGRTYLEQAEDEIVLLDLTKQYYDQIHSFYKWMMERVEAIHADEIEWLMKKSEEVKEVLEPLRNLPPDEGP